MKEIPSLVTLTEDVHSAIDKFSRRIAKRREYYDKFRPILLSSFDEVLQEEINVCVCCGLEFLGKSIGPHYKNSKKCAEFKRKKECRDEEPRKVLEPKMENNQQPAQAPLKLQEQEVQADAAQARENYDQLNEYFDSF